MKKFICLISLLIVFSSCKKEKLTYHAFEINKNINCDDLYDNQFRRVFGIDVLMIGKKIGDTIIHYEVTEHFDKSDFGKSKQNVRNDISKIEKKVYDKYREQDALELNDSIYQLVWEDIDYQRKYVCKKGEVYWRNFIVELNKPDIINYRNKIDTLNYKILEIENPSSYPLDSFEVVNLKTKDTFYCSIYEMDKKYYFSSTISIKKYE